MNTISSDNILEIKDLRVSFKNDRNELIPAIDGISFELRKGEILGIVGESGSGKSMTALSIIKLLPNKIAVLSEDSKIIFTKNGKKVNLIGLSEDNMVAYRGSEIGMIFQEPMSSLNPTMKCGKQVQEAVELHHDLSGNAAKQYVLELLEKVGLKDGERIYHSYPHQLSGGMVQRIMIAMAVSGNPSVLIADEPTTALDVTVQKGILALIRKIKNEFDSSTIFISHDLAVVNQLCDRVLVMQQGKVVEYGITEQVFKNPQESYTKGLIASRPPDDFKLKRLATVDYFTANPESDRASFFKDNILKPEAVNIKLKEIEQAELLLEVKGVTKDYDNSTAWKLFSKPSITRAVSNASFKLRKSEILGIVGESGSGKSTLSKIICKLEDANSGSVFFEGENIQSFDRKSLKEFRRKCQIIFQDPFSSLNPKMKIGKAIEEPYLVHKIGSKEDRKKWALELLQEVGLKEEHYNRYPHEFSGGQRQRIVIARALALKPKLLICDESVSALDVSIQAKILNLLLDLKDKYEMSYLFISHDLSVVHFIADNILVMKDGAIVEQGTAHSIYNNPTHDYTKNLISAIPKFDSKII